MASEVAKYSVFDPRIVQTKPKYAVEKGALSLTNVNFQAQTADASSVQFNVQVPSENVFVDRAVEWIGATVAVVSVTLTAGTLDIPAGTPLQGIVAPAAFPLHQAVSQMSATINDATVTVNTQDVLPQVLRLSDMRDARRQRTCPTMLDRYVVYPDSRVVKNSPLLGWDETKESDQVPNGGFQGFYYATSAAGAPQPFSGAGTTVGNVAYLNGQPQLAVDLAAAGVRVLTFYVVCASTEKLLLPPFIFSDQYEMSTGLFGVQNFQVQMNMSPNPSRAVRVSLATTLFRAETGKALDATLSAATSAWSTTAPVGGLWVTKPSLSVQFLTPALDIPLPPKSIVPYMEFPRYIATPTDPVLASVDYSTGGKQLQSQTITLPNIPDLLLIYVKPAAYSGSTQGDWSLPITNISLNFDNFSGLLANHTQKELYQMSVHNGVDMDWSEWSGLGSIPFSQVATTAATLTRGGGQVGLVGGPLVLRPGRDFALQTGQAPGLVGNFTLQFNLTVQNFTGATQTPNIYTVPISSGFFETIKGSSRIIKGVLTEQDILSAPPSAPEPDLERMVGDGRKPMGMGGARNKPSHMGMKAYM
jgi:hypothetical protein